MDSDELALRGQGAQRLHDSKRPSSLLGQAIGALFPMAGDYICPLLPPPSSFQMMCLPPPFLYPMLPPNHPTCAANKVRDWSFSRCKSNHITSLPAASCVKSTLLLRVYRYLHDRSLCLSPHLTGARCPPLQLLPYQQAHSYASVCALVLSLVPPHPAELRVHSPPPTTRPGGLPPLPTPSKGDPAPSPSHGPCSLNFTRLCHYWKPSCGFISFFHCLVPPTAASVRTGGLACLMSHRENPRGSGLGLTKREELSFLTVLAFPKASSSGLALMIWSSRVP